MKAQLQTALRAFFCLLFFALPGSVLTQEPTEIEGDGPIVRDIQVEFAGPANIAKQRILANMRTTVGQPFSQLTVEDDIRNLYASGDISNVRIFSEPVAGGVRVVVVVQPRTVIREIIVEGASRIKPRSIKRNLSVAVNKTLKEEELEADRQKILKMYSDKGFTDVDVQYKVETDEQGAYSTVLFAITEGEKLTIKRIAFEGNTVFNRKELMKVIKTRPRGILSPITRTGRIEAEKIDADSTALREHYQNAGYADADVLEVRRNPVRGGVELVFVISEGEPYTIGSVSFDGITLVSPEQAQTLLGIKPGDKYSPKNIQAGIGALDAHYGSQGYADMQASAETLPAGPGVLNLGVSVTEGAPSYIEQVRISGNSRTKDKVLRRELAVAPGDLYNTVLVDTSKRRLENLGFFERVETFPTDTGVEGRKDLNIVVQEKRTGNFTFGAGFSSIDSLIGFAELTQGNFDITNWRGFTGAGQKFRLRGQYGLQRRDFLISFIEPWFLDYQLQFGVEGYYRDSQFFSDVYDQTNAGGAIFFRKPLGEFSSVKIEYRGESIDIYDLSRNATEEFLLDEGDRFQSSVTVSYAFDRRDSTLLTRRGTRLDVYAGYMGGPLGGDTELYNLGAEVSHYIPLPFDTIFLINAEIAFVDSNDRVPVYNRLYLGGANSLRGFDFRDVGPKDELGEPIGGLSLGRLTLEYTFPIISRVRGAVFYDIGFVDEDSFKFGSDLNSDVGVGVRLDLPIGPVRIDVGFPIQADEENDKGARFNFNVGYQF